jgi:hypothetical protein
MAAGISGAVVATGCDTRRRAKTQRNAQLHDMWGGTTVEEYEFPPKPPRMRWVTYQRFEQQYDRLQDRWGVAIMARFGRYLVK